MKILVTGASGYLGTEISKQLSQLPYIELYAGYHCNQTRYGRPCPIDLSDPESVSNTLNTIRPDIIIHTAYDKRPEFFDSVIIKGTESLAHAARMIRFIFISTDFVFDGNNGPYDETASPNPNTAYGQAKYQAERIVTANCSNHLIIRTSLISGKDPIPPRWLNELEKLRQGHIVTFYTNEIRNPVHIVDLSRGIITSSLSDYTGRLHIAGPRYISRYEELEYFANWQGIDPSLIAGNISDGKNRPLNCSLIIDRFKALFPEIHLRDPAKFWE